MKNCLDEKTLLLIHDGEGSDAARAHLESCLSCARRFRQLADDLKDIVTVLKQPPPPAERRAPWKFAAVGWPLAAAVAALAFLAGGMTTAMLGTDLAVTARRATTRVASADRLEGIGGAAGYGLYVNNLLEEPDEADQLQVSAEEAPQRDLDEF